MYTYLNMDINQWGSTKTEFLEKIFFTGKLWKGP
jgi:hypothetical protein